MRAVSGQEARRTRLRHQHAKLLLGKGLEVITELSSAARREKSTPGRTFFRCGLQGERLRAVLRNPKLDLVLVRGGHFPPNSPGKRQTCADQEQACRFWDR